MRRYVAITAAIAATGITTLLVASLWLQPASGVLIALLVAAAIYAGLNRTGKALSEPGNEALPLWQRFVQALSEAGAVGNATPQPEWTQQDLADQLGVHVKRISELPSQLNHSAHAKWRQFVGEDAPERLSFVEKRRGATAGRPGVWTYYRLTEHGVRLARAIVDKNQTPGSAPLNSIDSAPA